MAIGLIGGVVGAIAGANSHLYTHREVSEPPLPKSDYADMEFTSGCRFLGLRAITYKWRPLFALAGKETAFLINEINLRLRAAGGRAAICADGFQTPCCGSEYVKHVGSRPPYLSDSYNTSITVTLDLHVGSDSAARATCKRLFTLSAHDLAGFRWPNAESHPDPYNDHDEVRCINEWKDMQKTHLIERLRDRLRIFITDDGQCGLLNLIRHMSGGEGFYPKWSDEFDAGARAANHQQTADKAQTTEP